MNSAGQGMTVVSRTLEYDGKLWKVESPWVWNNDGTIDIYRDGELVCRITDPNKVSEYVDKMNGMAAVLCPVCDEDVFAHYTPDGIWDAEHRGAVADLLTLSSVPPWAARMHS